MGKYVHNISLGNERTIYGSLRFLKEQKVQKCKTEPKIVPNVWFRTIFGSRKKLLAPQFSRTFSRGSKRSFFDEPSEMVKGNLKSHKGYLLK